MAVWDSAEQATRSPRSRRWLAEALAVLDARLRRRQAVFEYTQNPACVFRLDIGPVARTLALRDGTCVHAGQRMARLHFWNEQIPAVPRDGATIAWATPDAAGDSDFTPRTRKLSRRPARAWRCHASYAPSPLPARKPRREQLARIMARYGFEADRRARAIVDRRAAAPLWRKHPDFVDHPCT